MQCLCIVCLDAFHWANGGTVPDDYIYIHPMISSHLRLPIKLIFDVQRVGYIVLGKPRLYGDLPILIVTGISALHPST
jgi:hypothetical protein